MKIVRKLADEKKSIKNKNFPLRIIGMASWIDNAFVYATARDLHEGGKNGCTMNILQLMTADAERLRAHFPRLLQNEPIPFRFTADGQAIAAQPQASPLAAFVYYLKAAAEK